MPFKSDKMRKYVMLILTGGKRTITGYHASRRPLTKLNDRKPLHIGSQKQAEEYGKFWREQDMMGGTGSGRGNLFLYQVTVPVGKKRVLLSTMKTAARLSRVKPSNAWRTRYQVQQDRKRAKQDLAKQVRIAGGKRFLHEHVDWGRLNRYLNFEGEPGPGFGSGDPKVYRRLRKKFDVIPYTNTIEGHGLSVALLHPSKARFKLVRRWK